MVPLTTPLWLLISTFFVLLLCSPMGSYNILEICDQKWAQVCNANSRTRYGLVLNSSDSIHSVLLNGNYVGNLQSLENLQRYWDVIIIVGSGETVNAASTLAKSLDILAFVYDTSINSSSVYTDVTVPLNTGVKEMGLSMSALTGTYLSNLTCALVADELLYDEFLDGLFSNLDGNWTSNVIEIKSTDNFPKLFMKLHKLSELQCKLVIVYLFSHQLQNVFAAASTLNFVQSGFAWFVIDEDIGEFQWNMSGLPEGLLLVRRNTGVEEMTKLLKNVYKTLFEGFDAYTKSFTSIPQTLQTFLLRFLSIAPYHTQTFLQQNPFYNSTFEVFNLISNSPENVWKPVGTFNQHFQDIDTIIWPGNSLFGPIENNNRIYRVFTIPAAPFVFVKGPMDKDEQCFSEVSCIKLISGDPRFVMLDPISKSFLAKGNATFQYFCCSGIAVEIIHKLSIDLNFDFVLYFTDDNDYGQLTDDGLWTGMVGQVVGEMADIAIGALTINAERLQHLLFVEPFFSSGYSVITPSQAASPSIDAFTRPFDISVWLCIFLSATVTGFATSLLEWKSPFGLNPWGKKRCRNYTLGSGLVMAYSVLFGHTVYTKSPKGWPSKWVQNVWAAMAIFIIASYTANLAAYLAGNTGQNVIADIYDVTLLGKKVTADEASSALDYLRKINPTLGTNLISRHFNSTNEIIDYIKAGHADAYIGESAVLQYGLSIYDSNCSVVFSGREFGENLYSFALNKDATWLRAKFSALVMAYMESGFVDDLSRKYMAKRSCALNKHRGDMQYGLERTGGLFIMLIVAIFLSILLLGLEHAIFKFFVPFVRTKPSNSKWKSRNLEYINQRLFRTIMSQRLVSPQQTAREMVKMMKDRQFTRLFQKNELKCPNNSKKDAEKGLRFMNLTRSLIKLQKSEENQQSLESSDKSVFTTTSSGKYLGVPEAQDSLRFMDGDRGANGPQENRVSVNTYDLTSGEYFCHTPNNLRSNETYDSAIIGKSETSRYGDFRVNNHLWKGDEVFLESPNPSSLPYENLSKELANKRKMLIDSRMTAVDMDERSDIRDYCRKSTESLKRHGTWPSVYMEESPEINFATQTKSRNNSQNISVGSCGAISQPLKNDTKNGSDSQDNSNLDFSSDCRRFNYNKHSLKMKDNRVKSTIRRHAIAKFRKQSASVFDEFAVDDLTKEDLLALLKRSEIELQTKLNRILLQNAHLKRLLRMVDNNHRDTIYSDNGEGLSSDLVCTRL